MPLQGPAKVAIIGAGYVGASTAFALLFSPIVKEMVLVDINRRRAEGEAMDLAHAATLIRPVKIYAGGPADCAGARIIIFTAGANQQPGETRLDLVHRNTAIVREVLPPLLQYCPDALILMVANPVDVLTYVAWKISGLPENKVLGSGTVLDSARFRHLLSRHLHVDPRNIHAYVIGEHGDTEVPIWSLANVAGVDLEEFYLLDGTTEEETFRTGISRQVREAAYEIIERKGATAYGVALALSRITESILRDEKSVLTVSSVIRGLYGLEGEVAFSLPCLVGSQGREKILAIPLGAGELAALRHSATTLQEIITRLRLPG
ncbi:L-lactate/malate dehydrogenase [Moorella glycerini]|uniref:L-lactate dehydrogenase n=1 Tax=Neomoorella stamsii TaxID=1266720 RepID=A0A9X7J4X3_9FIRM|nr:MULTISPECIES: L-lactate dehydrogenase [Moorella]PRR75598.1 L-lactate dehydrogenase [Moorella stamsii]CEP66454.1 L-lactate/malate dehydrogenase [Moorella glycerini]